MLGALWTAPPCETFCSCVGPADALKARQGADAVFVGRVVHIRPTLVGWGVEGGPWMERRVTLRVDRAWKGVNARTVVLNTGRGGGDCGFPFRRGESYLVFAHEHEGSLGTGICTRTAYLTEAAVDIRDLGPPVRRWTRQGRR